MEVFDWAHGGLEPAHTNPAVHALWARCVSACDYDPLATLPESATMFSCFTPIAL